MNEQSSGGWTQMTVGETLLDIVAGKSPRAEGRPARGSERGVLKVSAVSWGEFRPEENKVLANSFVVDPELTVRAGDVLISRANTVELVGAVVQVERDHPQLMLSDKTLRLVPRPDLIEPRFLMYALRTTEVRAVFEEDATGTSDSMRNLSQDKIKSAPIQLPPIDVQRRIVAKLDALLSQTRAAREQLEAVPALVEQYRQSVLAAAFRGDLTADWRKQHPDVEPASKLLKRIRLERRAKWEAAELAKLKAKGKAPKDDKWKSKYVEPEPVDTSDLPELPPTWCWASFGEAAEIELDLVDPAGYRESPHIAPNHIESQTGRLLPFGTVATDGVTSPKSRFRSGQIIYSKIRPYLAKAVLVDFEGVCSADMYPLTTWMNPSLLLRWILSSRFTDWVSENQGRTVLPKINQEALVKVPVPVLPAAEQTQLSAQVELMLKATADTKEDSSDLVISFDALERSLLAKAFRGELVD